MDQTSDPQLKGLHAIITIAEAPDFVKELKTTRTFNKIAASNFADPGNKRFPVNSPADTWLSWGYQQLYEPDNEKVASAIKARAKFWDIELPNMFPPQKQASNGVLLKYAYLGETQHTVQVHDMEDLTKVASDLVLNRKKYPFDMCKNLARRVLKVASDLGGELEPSLKTSMQKQALYGIGDKTQVIQAIADLEYALEKCGARNIPDLRPAIEKAAAADANGFVGPDLLDKVAQFLDFSDRHSKRNNQYPEHAPPEERLVTHTLDELRGATQQYKEAAVMPDGSRVPFSELRQPAVRNLVSAIQGGTKKVAYADIPELIQGMSAVQKNLIHKAIKA